MGKKKDWRSETRDRKIDPATSALRKDIVKRLKAGQDDGEIMTATGCGPALIQRIRTGLGIYRNPYLSIEQTLQRIKLILTTNYSYSEINEKTGTSNTHRLGKLMKKMGFVFPPRKWGRPKKTD